MFSTSCQMTTRSMPSGGTASTTSGTTTGGGSGGGGGGRGGGAGATRSILSRTPRDLTGPSLSNAVAARSGGRDDPLPRAKTPSADTGVISTPHLYLVIIAGSESHALATFSAAAAPSGIARKRGAPAPPATAARGGGGGTRRNSTSTVVPARGTLILRLRSATAASSDSPDGLSRRLLPPRGTRSTSSLTSMNSRSSAKSAGAAPPEKMASKLTSAGGMLQEATPVMREAAITEPQPILHLKPNDDALDFHSGVELRFVGRVQTKELVTDTRHTRLASDEAGSRDV